MGVNPQTGIVGLLANPAGDQASYVVQGALGATGPGVPFVVMGPFNVSIWPSTTVSMTVTAGSTGATGGTGATAAAIAGASVNSKLVPPGTTVYAGGAVSFTLAMPTVTLSGFVNASAAQITGLPSSYNIAALLGAAVTGPGIPASTTVTAVNAGTSTVTISNAATASTPYNNQPQYFAFALTGNGIIASGTDAAAIFTSSAQGATGTVQIEKCFDGGNTWIVDSVPGSTGAPLIFTAGKPVSLSLGEPERGMLYRVNCPAYTSGTFNYKFSTTGAAAGSGGYNQLT